MFRSMKLEKNPLKSSIYVKEAKFIENFKDAYLDVCEKLNINGELIFKCFEHIMMFFQPQNNVIDQFHTFFELYNCLHDHFPEEKLIITSYNFIWTLQILPTSEASAERVFAKMRDIFNEKQTCLSPDFLRSN